MAAEVRLYDRLFRVENPLADKDVDYRKHLNPDSLQVVETAWVEPSVLADDGSPCHQFNRTVTLRDTWAKMRSG